MTYHRKPKSAPKINPEVEAFLTNVGPQLLSEFFQRCRNGKASLRGRNYETERDYSFRSAESQIYHDRMLDTHEKETT